MSTAEANNEVLSERLFSGEPAALSEGLFSNSAWLIMESSRVDSEKLAHAQIGLGALMLAMIGQPSESKSADSVHEVEAQGKERFGTGLSLSDPLGPRHFPLFHFPHFHADPNASNSREHNSAGV
jgi:hypothetical protein